jgi:hypothetical protein
LRHEHEVSAKWKKASLRPLNLWASGGLSRARIPHMPIPRATLESESCSTVNSRRSVV